MSARKSLILGTLPLLLAGCGKSTLADCDKIDGDVSIFGSTSPEFSWEGGSSDEILVSRTGDGVEIWNVYVDSDDEDALNQIASPVSFGVLPDVEEGVELVENIPASDLEMGVAYQVQVIIQCEGGGALNQLGTWTIEEE